MSLIHPIHLPSRWDWWDMTVGVPAVGLIWPGPRRRPLNASTFHVRFYTGPPDMRTVPSCASLCQLCAFAAAASVFSQPGTPSSLISPANFPDSVVGNKQSRQAQRTTQADLSRLIETLN